MTSHAMMSLFTKLRADMQIPPIIELEQAAKKLVWAAKKDGTLKFVHKISKFMKQQWNSLVN